MPIQLFYKLQTIDVKEYQTLFNSSIVRQAILQHLNDAVANAQTPTPASTAPAPSPTCLTYNDYVFSFPICWFRAFILMLCVPNRIRVNDLKMLPKNVPAITNTSVNNEYINNTIYGSDTTNTTLNIETKKNYIEMLLFYILTKNVAEGNVYTFKDDVILMLLRLLHSYKPTLYTNPGFYGDFIYYYPLHMLKEFDIFREFAVVDRRNVKKNQTLPSIPQCKRHVIMMYKYNQPLNIDINNGNYGISAIYMLNYNIFKLKHALNNHAICIYQCDDNKWYSNELTNTTDVGAVTGELTNFSLSSDSDIIQSKFHEKFNLKFNIHKGCRIVHYIKYDPIHQTTSYNIRQPQKTIKFVSLTQLLFYMMKATNEYIIEIQNIKFAYNYKINDDGYKHTMKVTMNTASNKYKCETYFFQVSRVNLTYKIESKVKNLTAPINLADLDRILLSEYLSLIGICNQAISSSGLDAINHHMGSAATEDSIKIKGPESLLEQYELIDKRRGQISSVVKNKLGGQKRYKRKTK